MRFAAAGLTAACLPAFLMLNHQNSVFAQLQPHKDPFTIRKDLFQIHSRNRIKISEQAYLEKDTFILHSPYKQTSFCFRLTAASFVFTRFLELKSKITFSTKENKTETFKKQKCAKYQSSAEVKIQTSQCLESSRSFT